MIIEAATVFRAVLLGVKVIHNRRWLHRDLKPTNIGLIGKPLCSILLDVSISRHI
jgi:serine/threonine protein kinase